jgi:hypothetical protein
MTAESFDRLTTNARGEYQALSYRGPALDPRRFPVQARYWPRVLVPVALAAAVLTFSYLQFPYADSSGPYQGNTDHYDALALARQQLEASEFRSPDRPMTAYFSIPAPPDRESGFAADPDLG